MEIECAFDYCDWTIRTTKSVYFCEVTSCNITSRGLVTFKGVHKPQKNDESVKAVWFENTTCTYIPKNLKQHFPNLAHLTIDHCELKEISVEDMVGLENLRGFDLINNHITTLPVDLFKNMKKLQEVNFSYNLIEKFDAKILEPIKNTIEYFTIFGNPGISTAFIKTEAFDDFIERLKLIESNKFNSKRFNDQYTSGKYSDFTIKVQEKEYKVHKVVLASMSSVFDKTFSDDTEATSKTFDNTENFSADAIEEFLRYFYSRAAPSEENAKELLTLAVKFDVPDLKLRCETTLVDMIEPENAQQLFDFASEKSLPQLKRKAIEVIKESHPEIPDYAYDRPQLVNQLIEAKEDSKAKKIKLEKEE